MNKLTYYRCSLALPLLLPLLFHPFWREGDSPLNLLGFLLLMSLAFGGVPYAILAIALLIWSRGKDAEQMQRILWLAPALMVPILWLCCILYAAVQPQGSVLQSDAISRAIFLPGFVLIYGYAYVLIVLAGLALLQRIYGFKERRLQAHRAEMFSEAMKENGAKEGH